jgi:3-phytase
MFSPARHHRSWGSDGRPHATPTVLTVCAVLSLAACSGEPESRAAASAPAASGVVAEEVSATVETEPVPHEGDAADDPAVWVNPVDPSLSAVVATDKDGGLLVYDLAGRQLQYLEVGDMNNVDLRPAAEGFTLGGRPVVLVVAGNRKPNSLGVFELDPATRQLRDVAGAAIEPDIEVYGSCMYRSADTGKVYVFVNSKTGEVQQWELTDDGSGRVVGEQVRSFRVESQPEGCVADDELGHLYLGEEGRGIWKFGAEPDAGDTGDLIAAAADSGPLVPDVEGLAIAARPDGTGYLIASSQGDSSYAVYEREGEHAYVGSFRIRDGSGIDGTSDTDGIDVAATPLGASFPSGVFVAQDGENDGQTQNYKLVPLEQIFPD